MKIGELIHGGFNGSCKSKVTTKKQKKDWQTMSLVLVICGESKQRTERMARFIGLTGV